MSGGDISDACVIRLRDGRELFLKTNAAAPPSMFPREADGLRWLAASGALRIPEVVAVDPSFLVLERIVPGAPARDHDEKLGRGLAALHRSSADAFGGCDDNYVGHLPQDNRDAPDWPTFYRDRRLGPLVRTAAARGLVRTEMRRSFDRLFERLPELCGPPEPPARLHGDLWGGNALTDARSHPVLIDPAVYGGHREVDLAMMRLFGGFGARVFDAYHEAWPLSPEAERRVPLYQLYPLLVHVCLFGGAYVGQLRRALSQLD